jgi:hypothetical protein
MVPIPVLTPSPIIDTHNRDTGLSITAGFEWWNMLREAKSMALSACNLSFDMSGELLKSQVGNE